MTLPPLRFGPLYKEKVWGGRRMADLCGRRLPPGARVGESWEIADHGPDVSVVDGGPLDGMFLRDLVAARREELLGGSAAAGPPDRFPLLVKLLDAAENLSVQVHPPDDYAARHEGGEPGKTELWYVLHADPGAELICGLAGAVDRETFARRMEAGDILGCLRRFPVRSGDAVFVPAGRVHSICAGSLILEIEQNSDVTYRLHDWGRGGAGGPARPLHGEKALDVLDFGDRGEPRVGKRWRRDGGAARAALADCRYFKTEEVEIADRWAPRLEGGRLRVLSAVRGRGALACAGCDGMELRPGDSILLPASLGEWEVRAAAGGCGLLITEVPS
ncbi:MAG: class I mannose-6-phosphate isomerase [bacterium]|nr:class I mannose-6-phosphate isomerase [bacterium]